MRSARFLIVTALLVVCSLASFFMAVSDIREGTSETTDFLYLSLFTTSSSSMYSILTFMAFLGPLVGIVMGFDAISRERSLGTLNRLASQPIYRDYIISAKFVAGFTTILLMVFSLGIIVVAGGLLFIGLPPEGEEILRIIAFLFLITFYLTFWLALMILFSVITKHSATAALVGIALWIFLSFFMSMVAESIANIIYPVDGVDAYANAMSNYTLELGLNRISPYYLFYEASSTILNPNVRSVGVITTSQLSGMVAGYLPFGQSLLLVWPHVVCIVALSLICFAIGYICFMRQEIRA